MRSWVRNCSYSFPTCNIRNPSPASIKSSCITGRRRCVPENVSASEVLMIAFKYYKKMLAAAAKAPNFARPGRRAMRRRSRLRVKSACWTPLSIRLKIRLVATLYTREAEMSAVTTPTAYFQSISRTKSVEYYRAMITSSEQWIAHVSMVEKYYHLQQRGAPQRWRQPQAPVSSTRYVCKVISVPPNASRARVATPST